MSHAELILKVEQLTEQLEEQSKRHTEAITSLRNEAKQLRKKISAILENSRAKECDDKYVPGDDTFIRSVEWRIEDYSGRIKDTPRNEAIWSVEFSVLGIPGLQLEFFPQGRDSTEVPGFCGLFLWCPAGVKIKYQLRVGSHKAAPDEDEYVGRMGHGHSTFCALEGQNDVATNSVVVGLDIHSISYMTEPIQSIRLVNAGPEAQVERETAVLRNSDLDCVEWRIKNIIRRANEVPRGTAICSPLFSIAGIREMLLEFYPNGIHPPPGAKEGREGFCGFYVRAQRSGGASLTSTLTLMLTLFVGGVRKGPIKTEFVENASKGLPEFCRLEDQLCEGEDDLIVGVLVQNPELEQQRTELYLDPPPPGGR